jgi:hypothetical protein
MAPVQWNCKTCGEEFNTKGKRDHHHRKEHRNSANEGPAGSFDTSVHRSEGGKFMCECKRGYESIQSLRRHKKTCTAQILMDDDENSMDGMST